MADRAIIATGIADRRAVEAAVAAINAATSGAEHDAAFGDFMRLLGEKYPAAIAADMKNAAADDAYQDLMQVISRGDGDEIGARLAALPAGERSTAMSTRDASGHSLVMEAARAGSAAAMTALLRNGADPCSRLRASGNTAAHLAAMGGHLKALRALLDGAPAAMLATLPNLHGDTPLMFACAGSGPSQAAVCALLLNRGADPNAANRDGITPAMVAAGMGDALILAALLRRAAPAPAAQAAASTSSSAGSSRTGSSSTATSLDALLGARDVHGNTPLSYASRAGHAECVRLLLDAGRSAAPGAARDQLFGRNAAGRTPLDEARLARGSGGGSGGGGGGGGGGSVVALLEAAIAAASAGSEAVAAELLDKHASEAAKTAKLASTSTSRGPGRGKQQPQQQQEQEQQQEEEDEEAKEEGLHQKQEQQQQQQQQDAGQGPPQPAKAYSPDDGAAAGAWTTVRAKGRHAPDAAAGAAPAASGASAKSSPSVVQQPPPPPQQQQQQHQQQHQQQPAAARATSSWAKVVRGRDDASGSSGGANSAENAQGGALGQQIQQQQQQQQQQHQGPDTSAASDSGADDSDGADDGPERLPLGWLDDARACIAELCPAAPALAISPAHVLGVGLAGLSAAQLEAVEAVHRGALTRVAEARAALAAAAAEAHVAERARLAEEIARLRAALEDETKQ